MKIKKLLLHRFKKISALDAFIFLILIAFVFFVIKYLARIKGEWIYVAVDVRGKEWQEDWSDGYSFEPPIWVGEKINIGDEIFSVSHEKIAEVVDVHRYRGRKSLFLILYAKVGSANKGRSILFQDNELKVGNEVELTFKDTNVIGQVFDLDLQKSNYPKKKFLVKARKKNFDRTLFESFDVQVGDKMIDLGANETIAEVKSIKAEPSSLTLFTQTEIRFNQTESMRQYFAQSKEDFIDLYLTFEIQVYQIGDILYFIIPNQQLRKGNFFGFDSDDYSLNWLEILEIQPIES